MTYEQVAKEMNLPKYIAERFVMYMKKRWADSEETKCFTGYAHEWAYRFREGSEYVCSDSEGRAVLREMNDLLTKEQ